MFVAHLHPSYFLQTMQEKKERAKLTKEQIKKASRILKFIVPYKWIFSIGFFMLMLNSISSLALFNFMGDLIDIKSENFSSEIRNITILLFVILILQAVTSFVRIYTFSLVTEKAMAAIRQKVFENLIHLPMSFFAGRRVGELNSRLSSDISSIQGTLTTTIAEFVRGIIIIVGSIVLLAITSLKLTSFVLSVLPLMVIFAVVFGKYIKKLSKEAQDITADAQTILEEAMQGIVAVKAFTGELFEYNRYKSKTDKIIEIGIRNSIYRGVFASFIIVFLFGAIMGVVWYGASLVRTGELTEGELFKFFLLSVFLAASVGGMAESYAQIQKAIGATENVLDIMEEKTEDRSETFDKIEIKGEVSVRNLNFSYPSTNLPVLKNVSFRVKSGENIAIVGPSGAGKTTLSSILLRLYDDYSGEIWVDNQELRSYNLKAYRENIAIVPQDIVLFGGTVYENILYGKPTATKEEVEIAAKRAFAHEFILDLPNQYNTIVGERGTKLSGGQRQRIAIARALLKNPAILILDEATSSLDSESEQYVQSALSEVMKGRTTFVIAHRLSTIKNCDKILVLEKGKVVEFGSHSQLITNESGLYKMLLSMQYQKSDETNKFAD